MDPQDPAAVDLLHERYGTPRRWQRVATISVSVLIAASFGIWLTWTTWVHANPDVSSELLHFEIRGEHQATATLTVTISDDVAPSTVRCLLRASAVDHNVVGELTFTPTGSGRTVQDIRTERTATSVELVGCTTPDQKRPN